MLSHLRFHRRGPSNPASPLPDQHTTSPHSSLFSPFTSDALSPDLPTPSSGSPALPPTLPPIARVTSAETEPKLDYQRNADMVPQPDSRPQQQPSRSPYNISSSFIGGLALQKYQRNMEAHNNDGVDNTKGTPGNQSGPSRPPPQALRNSKQPASFSTPTDLQNSTPAPTGLRPAGTRLHTDLPSLYTSTSNPQPTKPKKGLPFLKNPMSTLLSRRKNNQQAPSLVTLPPKNGPEEPMYDPRIKGTRVHDFSAPRSKRATAPSNGPAYALSPSHPSPLLEQEKAGTQRNPSSAASASVYSQDSQAPNVTLKSPDPAERSDRFPPPPPPQYTPPGPPPYDDDPISVQPKPSHASRHIDDSSSVYSRASTRVGPSRGPSTSGRDPSALPRHMKSTSSRFSFDMIGAAGKEQEKLLEDRHRQREAEKQTPDPPSHRDSRFDDFDEDAFDYDAMMDDDGLEEPIPENNADYDEADYFEEEIPMVGDDDVGEEYDPDNDQENFSGFVFQRSNPTSSLVSPLSAGFIITPRDADGNAIGYAMSKDSPRLPDSVSPNLLSPQMIPNSGMQAGGLGIQGLDLPVPTQVEDEPAFQTNQQVPPEDLPQSNRPDDLYFDDGMLNYEKNEFAEDLAAPPEWDDTPFDESIFDNNDTDQYGRPIAGAFAQAQADRRAAQDEVVIKRESDLTSRFSAVSGASDSTAHTSLSVNGQKPLSCEEPQESSSHQSPEESSASQGANPEGNTMAAYQAALAAAAHEAVLSGKFQRATSPSQDEAPSSEYGQSPDTPDHEDSFANGGYDDYGYEDMADFELDDDAIIAEANASALANDSDGWYGQEFGFFSAPTGSHHGQQPVTEYEYANGGFFGPKGGLDRSTSGRMVSREPNLTPITERSEYSNRNSMMSLNMPGFSSGTPLQSPGLAQLALLGDRGDEMSLSALLRLRSKAWGSQVSLVSSGGSPRSERGDGPSSPWAPTFSSPTTYHARKNSVLSTVSQDSEDDISMSGSPTLTTGFLVPDACPPPVPPLVDRGASISTSASKSPHLEYVVSPVTSTGEPPLSACGISPVERHSSSESAGSNIPSRFSGMGHRHKTSAESISYTKEEESGEARWVLERRRTGDAGQEILEREFIEGQI